MLVTFEGLDCAGKSSLMREVAHRLRLTVTEPVMHLGDISQSPTGRRLGEVFRTEEMFGLDAASTGISRGLAAAADLFYFDGALIAPMVTAGGIVLKERHVDTLISHEGPVLARRCGWSDDRAERWLGSVVEPLQVRPALTVLVGAPLSHRQRRLSDRMAEAGGVITRTQAALDRAVFRIRAEWYERLRLRERSRWMTVANPDGELNRAIARVVAAILERRDRQRGAEAPAILGTSD